MDEKLKQKLIEAVKAGDENQASELLWQLVIDCQNCSFKTVSGLPFSYTIKRGRNGELTKELWIDRRENSKSLAWSSIRLAFSKRIITRPSPPPSHMISACATKSALARSSAVPEAGSLDEGSSA